jgi:hypothetical protein
MTLAEYDGAISMLRRAKHQQAPLGMYMSSENEIGNYPADAAARRLAWRWLDRAEHHLTCRLDREFRGGADARSNP